MKTPILIGIIVFILDQITKFIIFKFIPYNYAINVVELFNFFNIVNIGNTGAAFSIFQGKNNVFSILIFIFLSLIIVYVYKNRSKISKLQKYAYCLILSGGLGNLTDRLFRGAVVDFLDFGINSLRWPAFNIADSCICIAIALLIADLLPIGCKKFYNML
jgi:signal peptidase II